MVAALAKVAATSKHNKKVRGNRAKVSSLTTYVSLLKDVHLTVPMHPCNLKYLKFTIHTFELNNAPFVFTKLMKPVMEILRKLRIQVGLRTCI